MMSSPSRPKSPDMILPIRVAPDKKLNYLKIITNLKEKYTDQNFIELNWWDIIMPCLDEHGIKLTLHEMAIVLLVLRKKAFLI